MSHKLHSEEFFGDYRDYWWNQDFLALMAKRWNLSGIDKVLDAGCGIGHWGFVLEPHLPKDCQLIGVDREPEWVAKASARATERGFGGRFSYQMACVEQLPFEDATFDMVTCQTVLMHVPSPLDVLREFLRVLKPGGLLAVAEPNNLIGSLVGSTISAVQSADDILKGVRFQLLCDKGKTALGEGDSSIGDLMPGYFSELGLQGIMTYLSDKASPLFPPYESLEQRVLLAQANEWCAEEFLAKWKVDSHRYFVAGGGSELEFKELWQWSIDSRLAQQAIEAKTYHSAQGSMNYLVSGRKLSS